MPHVHPHRGATVAAMVVGGVVWEFIDSGVSTTPPDSIGTTTTTHSSFTTLHLPDVFTWKLLPEKFTWRIYLKLVTWKIYFKSLSDRCYFSDCSCLPGNTSWHKYVRYIPIYTWLCLRFNSLSGTSFYNFKFTWRIYLKIITWEVYLTYVPETCYMKNVLPIITWQMLLQWLLMFTREHLLTQVRPIYTYSCLRFLECIFGMTFIYLFFFYLFIHYLIILPGYITWLVYLVSISGEFTWGVYLGIYLRHHVLKPYPQVSTPW